MTSAKLVNEEIRRVLEAHMRSDWRKGLWQIVNTVVPCLALWVLMFFSLRISYWLTLGLAVVTAAFLVRTFIIFHDCGHNSFFSSRRANHIVGFFTGVLTLTPNHRWWGDHTRHHASTGNLDKRGVGDVWMMTVEQYRQSNWITRVWYRLYRNPIFMFTVGPFLIFGILNRIPSPKARRHEFSSVVWTNIALVVIWITLALTVGFESYLRIHLPVLLFSGMAGLWLFYVQHNYEFAYWKRTPEHDNATAALLGSSYYRLPRVLQWFSGNIGFHHIHHLGPRIPNYLLESCHRSLPEIPNITTFGLRASFRSLSLRLWDETSQRMISFGEYKRLRRH